MWNTKDDRPLLEEENKEFERKKNMKGWNWNHSSAYWLSIIRTGIYKHVLLQWCVEWGRAQFYSSLLTHTENLIYVVIRTNKTLPLSLNDHTIIRKGDVGAATQGSAWKMHRAGFVRREITSVVQDPSVIIPFSRWNGRNTEEVSILS